MFDAACFAVYLVLTDYVVRVCLFCFVCVLFVCFVVSLVFGFCLLILVSLFVCLRFCLLLW